MTTEIIISIASVIIAVVSAVIAGMTISQNNKLQNRSLTHQNYEYMKEWFQETLYLTSIPGMAESIIEGGKTPLEDCVSENEVEW